MSGDLRLLAGAVALSAAGDMLAVIVLALQVHALTGDGIAVAALFATAAVPMIALAPLAGLVADRLPRAQVLVVASLVQAAAAVGLAHAGGLAAILALSAVLAAGNAFAQPAEFALVPAVAPAGGLARATGVVESARATGLAAGPLLAAGLAALGPRPALLADAASFLAIAAAAAAMRPRPAPAPVARGRQRALDGARLIRRDPVLRVTLGAAVGALLLISATLTVEVFYVKDVVGAGDVAYALLVGAWMAGLVAGGACLAPRVPVALAAGGALVALAVQGAGLAAQTAWAVLPVAFAGYLVGGVGHGVKNVLLRVMLTHRVPEALHGRAFAAYNAGRNGAELAAVAAGGVLVGALGPRAALLLAGLAPVAVAAAGLAALRAQRRPAARRGLNGAREAA